MLYPGYGVLLEHFTGEPAWLAERAQAACPKPWAAADSHDSAYGTAGGWNGGTSVPFSLCAEPVRVLHYGLLWEAGNDTGYFFDKVFLGYHLTRYSFTRYFFGYFFDEVFP
jgi:hypothetical protein